MCQISRRLLGWVCLGWVCLGCAGVALGAPASDPAAAGAADRAYQVQVLTRFARPVLAALAEGRLKATLPVHDWERQSKRDRFVVLEAAGRTLSGVAPWLELGPDATPEGRLRAEFIDLARRGLVQLTDPAGPDFGNFNRWGQPLVDAAYLAYALLRAPQQLWAPLTDAQRAHVVAALQSTRCLKPGANNWLFFPAMIEAALWERTGQADPKPIETALTSFTNWYVGDGVYSDGPPWHWDYYNSYVIQPFQLEVLAVCRRHGHPLARLLPPAEAHAQRYAAVQERLISPEGTFPVLGRSSVYRFAAFHHLAYMALTHRLPPTLAPGAVRGALTTVVRRMAEAPGTLDAAGWLQPGAVGHQETMRDPYNNSGSFYICLTGLIALGLPPDDPFWTAPAASWTQRRLWAGEEVGRDHAL